MKEKILNNLTLKLASAILALTVWVIVTNIYNPVIIKNIGVPVKIINENHVPGNKTYEIQDSLYCTFRCKISKEDDYYVTQNDIDAYIDLSELKNGTNLTIHYKIPNSVDMRISDIRQTPEYIRVKVNDVSSNAFPVKYQIMGNTDEAHSIGTVGLSHNVVYITGNDEIIKNISHVSIDIDLSKMAGNEDVIQGSSKVHVIDKNGKEISDENIELSVNEIMYSVTLFTKANVILEVETEGPSRTVGTSNIIIDPPIIIIEGPKNVLSGITSIKLPEVINIDAFTEPQEFTFLVADVIPSGTRCTSATEIKVMVNPKSNIIGGPIG